jgi:alanine dehydrogenase
MRIGVPTEVKPDEFRVAATPAGVRELTTSGHEVLVQAGAGGGSHLSDAEYVAAGATILPTADEVWGEADLILKVKEPIAEEYHRIRSGQTLFTYLHLAASRECTDALLASGATAIAYETVQAADGSLPLLAPMSEVAGRMAPQVAAHFLEKYAGGRGVLLGGVPGVRPTKVLILGAGTSGMSAALIALGLQADVTLLDKNVERLRQADRIFSGQVTTVYSTVHEVERAALESDVVIGAVLIPGAKAPVLISDDLVSRMRDGAVLVDIAVDQGGCFESTRPTTHHDPIYPVKQTTFYCVANMPGAVPATSTFALTNVTLPFVERLAHLGPKAAVQQDPMLRSGVNVAGGAITYQGVADAFGLPLANLADVL